MKENDVKIRVVIRKRPISSKEKSTNDVDILEKRTKNSVVVKELR
jgi:hypothetical protein